MMNTFKIGGRAMVTAQAMVALGALVGVAIGMPTPAEAKPTKFYITPELVEGNAALTACAAGYHMASFWEISDTSNLKYDTGRGILNADSGSGPPAEQWGWVRTGSFSDGAGQIGASNCVAWTSNSDARYGTFVFLNPDWGPSAITAWLASVINCDYALHVWCVRN